MLECCCEKYCKLYPAAIFPTGLKERVMKTMSVFIVEPQNSVAIMLGKSTEKGNNARLFFCSSCVPLAATQQTRILSQSSPPIVLQSAYTFHPFLISLLCGIQYTVHTEECKKVIAHRRF